MDVAELRKRILRQIDLAKRDADTRRRDADTARDDYARLLDNTIVPLVKQASHILRAEGIGCQTSTPAGSVRLGSDRSNDRFVEFALDTHAEPPHVICRVSSQGPSGVVINEYAIAPAKLIADIDEQDILDSFLPSLRRVI